MADDKRKLGRGIASLLEMDSDIDTSILGDNTINDNIDIKDKVVELDLNDIVANKQQPRKYFDDVKLKELSESIKNNGLLQPIIVAKQPNGAEGKYIIVAGERRYRASKMAGLKTIKSIIVEMDDKDILRNDIIENFGYTHEQLAKEVGKSRAHITNLLRVLNLPDEILSALRNGNITLGHAKVLLGTDNPNDYIEEIISNQLSVRQLESLVKNGYVEEPAPKHDVSGVRDEIINGDKYNEDVLMRDSSIKAKPEDLTFDIIKEMYGIQQNAVGEVDYETGEIKEGQLSSEEKEAIKNNLRAIEECILQSSGIVVKLKLNHNGSGKVEIDYNDADELLKIVRLFQK